MTPNTPANRIEAPDYHGAVHDSSAPLPHHKINYYAIFALLVMLTIVTVAVAFLNIRTELVKILLALTIASIKAGFVATYFMHLKFEGKLIYAIIIVPLILTVLLVCALLPDQVVVFHAFDPAAGQ